MRSYGVDPNTQQWVEITETGYVWLATLAQTLRLNEGESPVYGNYGIPAQQSIMSQIAPDAAVNRTQSQYSPYFSQLQVIRNQLATQPTYYVNAVFLNGTTIQTTVAT
jgi:hypothetical protein